MGLLVNCRALLIINSLRMRRIGNGESFGSLGRTERWCRDGQNVNFIVVGVMVTAEKAEEARSL